MPRKRGSGTRKQANWTSLTPCSESECRDVLRHAFDALDQAGSLDEIKEIRDVAGVVRGVAMDLEAGFWVRSKASELKLRAEYRAGDFLRSMSLRGGDRKSGNRHLRDTLNSLGITQNQSTRWQKMATVPEEDLW